MKPCCKGCTVKIDQSILYDEATCYKTCKEWENDKENNIPM